MGGMSTDSAKCKKVWDEDIRVYSGYGFKPVVLTKLMKMAWKVPQFIKAKFMYCLEYRLGAMVAWTWSELAVYGIKDSPKKESEILIKMFHIYLIVHCFLIKRKWMKNIVLSFSSCSLYALCHQFSQALEGTRLGALEETRLGAISPVLGGNRRNRKMVSFLPLRLSCKESSTSNQAFSIVFTTLSIPLVGDRNLRRKDVTALRCSEPLRSKVGGPSKVFAILCGMGPLGNSSLQYIVYS